MALRLLHLSDIHFRTYKEEEGYLDLDRDIQNEMELDLQEITNATGRIHSLLIGGDVAFSGHELEYEFAHNWIAKVCGIVGCQAENVLTVPGNHDVQRNKICPALKDIQATFKGLRSAHEIDSKLEKYLKAEDSVSILLKPFSNYNNFAVRYRSSTQQVNNLYWEKEFLLEDNQKLRIRGVNSAIISNEKDDEHSSKLILGTHQSQLQREKGVINLVLCHHPPQWLYDGDEVRKTLNARANIVLFGHKHEYDVNVTDKTVVLSAGAMQPDRGNQWEPTYNLLEIDTIKRDTQRILLLRVWRRVWDHKEKKFRAHYGNQGKEVVEYEIAYDQLIDGNSDIKGKQAVNENLTASAATKEIEQINVNKQDPYRVLAYMFLSLPYHKMLRVAVELELILDSDKELNELQKSEAYYKRAIEKNLERSLWDKVNTYSNDSSRKPNPFT